MTAPVTPHALTDELLSEAEKDDPAVIAEAHVAREAATDPQVRAFLDPDWKQVAGKLAKSVIRLRAALEMCADPEDGWPEAECADAYEASRKLVPEMEGEDAEIDAALRAVLAPALAPQWQPIETAATECVNGEPYLVYHHDWGMSVQWFAEKGTYRGFNWRADPGTAEPTHWQPLPPAPAEKGPRT